MSTRRPLSGVRVLEFAQLFPGPYAGLVLASLGADVVKVEPPAGDATRAVPPLVEDAGGAGALFCALNRGKRSVVLDLKTPEGVEAYRRLARACRVVLDGYRAGVADRLGVGFEALCAGRSDLTYVTLSGFGFEGPMEAEPGHDVTYQAWMGAIDPGDPWLPNLPTADACGALWAALLGAVHLNVSGNHRVDTSLAGSLAAPMFMHTALAAAGAATNPVRHGLPGYNVYRCADGRAIAVGALEPRFWKRLCELFGDEALYGSGDPANELDAEAVRETAAHFERDARDAWVARLRAAGVPCAPVRSVEEALSRPARVTSWDPPGVSGVDDLRGAPALGQHTEEVLSELG